MGTRDDRREPVQCAVCRRTMGVEGKVGPPTIIGHVCRSCRDAIHLDITRVVDAVRRVLA